MSDNLNTQNRSSVISRTLTVFAWLFYAVFIFERLVEFPIYFFCDEAIHGVEAQNILTTGRDQTGAWFPVLFQGFGDYQLAFSIYLQIPFNLLFGLSEWSVRARTAVISMLGVAAVYLLIGRRLKLSSAFLAPMVFAVTPVWFLHSRSGFEAVPAVSFYLAFLYSYIVAFTTDRRAAVFAALFCALCFYTYTPARGWIPLALVLLLIVNLPGHIRHWRTTIVAALVFAVLSIPFGVVSFMHPERSTKRLESIGYKEFSELSFEGKVRKIGANYANIMTPQFWYTWEGTIRDGPEERHVIPGHPLLPLWTAPFAVLGLLFLLYRIRSLESRALLVGLMVAPFPASLVGFTNLRTLPVGILYLVFSLIGAGVLLQIVRNRKLIDGVVQVGLFAALVSYGASFREYVYNRAKFDYRDYAFYGVQLGAADVFGWISRNHRQYELFRPSGALFNAGNVFIPFYLKGEAAEKTTLYDAGLICKTEPSQLSDRILWITRVDEYERISNCSPVNLEIKHSVSDPHGRPLFYFFVASGSKDAQPS